MSIRLQGWLMVALLCGQGLAQEPADPADEPVDRDFVRQVAQAYYDALARKDFETTAQREVFVVQPTAPDLAAYSEEMEKHPYAGARRIECSITGIDPDRACLGLKVHLNGGTITERATWSRTGTPKQWVVQATTMTLAGMPGYEVVTVDAPPPVKEPAVKSTVIVRDRNQQDSVIVPGNDGPVQFVRPPKVMPAGKTGAAAYVLGNIKNTGTVAVADIVIHAVVRAEDGTVLETREFRPAKTQLAPDAVVSFSGMLDHLAPKRTEFSVQVKE